MWYESYDGDAAGVIAHLTALGASWVVVKLADGTSWGTATQPSVFHDQVVDLVGKLKAAGFHVSAWVYDYLSDPQGEADKAAAAAALGADGLVFDVEYEAVGKAAQAEAFFARLMPQLPAGYPLAFAPDFRILVGNSYAPWSAASLDLTTEPWPWSSFATRCQVVMPQLYETDFAVTPDTVFGLVDAWNALAAQNGWKLDLAPIFPSDATPSDLARAVTLAGQYGAIGYSLWRLDDAPTTPVPPLP